MELPQRLHPTPLKAEYLIGYSIGAAAMLIGGGLLLALYLGLLPSGLVPALPSPIAGIVALLPYLLLGLLVLYGAYKLLYTELRLRRWHTYTFYDDHVVVEKGYYYWFEHKSDDIPYHQITNVFVEEDWSGFVYLGNLKVIMEGSSEPVVIEGLRNPHPFERLMMGADPAEITLTSHEERGELYETETSEVTPGDIREELAQLRQTYEDGDIGRAEYEERYYRLKGKMEELEREGDVEEDVSSWEESEAADIRREMEMVEDRYDAGELSREEYEQRYYYLKGELDALEEEQ